MNSPHDLVVGGFTADAAMEIEEPDAMEADENDDPFLKFIDHAKSILCDNDGGSEEETTHSPGWSWIANRILRTCVAYSSGVTPAILLSELSLAWHEQNRSGAPKTQSDIVAQLKKKHKRVKLPNTITIDSIYEKKFLSLSSVIEAVVIDAFTLPGTNISMLTLGDIWSSHTIDLYLHRRFYDIADPKNGILKKGREVLLTGCYLRVATGNSACARLLPTEYFVVLLDEDEDDDAMLLGAQFCSDSFSSISLDAVKQGTSYSLYARIEHIGQLENQGRYGNLQRKEITLVDNDGMRLKFLLWGEQTLVANLFSVGSMLALDRPFIASAEDSSLETCDGVCLEYGSATLLYLVPLIPLKEQVSIALTQHLHQSSRHLTAASLSQGQLVSQVTLPCDSKGSIDFSNCPVRSYVVDLRDKMTGISLYGTVTGIRAAEGLYSLRIDDTTGAIWVKLHFVGYWSLGRLGIGHTVYLSGLSSLLASRKSLELSWHENGTGSSFFNLSSLPAFLNTSCLHRLLTLSDISTHVKGAQVCRVWVDQIDHCHVDTRYLHSVCGHLIEELPNGDFNCEFCNRICIGEVERTFLLKITIADERAKVFAWCVGHTAAELLQITPDEFCQLPEEEQIMYPSSFEHEKFIVAIAHCRSQYFAGFLEKGHDMVDWEITRAIKFD
ncbi:nucleic acid-binding proteins superfamily [Striga asiatica]|uniref:Nucleic acid-binding proteins superfamily n=1 Tax=Striga asiatica TaxID=4170 RepID=A0A5A7PKJ2_STRAF|nr:nucleic acid-binding proteins superfamily [Striga asiatica]